MGETNGNNGRPGFLDRFVDIRLSEERLKTILDDRAEVLAQTPQDEASGHQARQFVIFALGSERYGLEVKYVEEIQPVKAITKIPCTPDFVAGAVNVRGSILPVVDLKSFFNLPKEEGPEALKIIVLDVDQTRLGLLAKDVEEIVDISETEIGSQIATLSGTTEEFIKGVTESSIIIVDIAALVTDRRMIIHDEI